MIHSIIKRDGRVVLYDQNKIAAAILKALEASGDGNDGVGRDPAGTAHHLTALPGTLLRDGAGMNDTEIAGFPKGNETGPFFLKKAP